MYIYDYMCTNFSVPSGNNLPFVDNETKTKRKLLFIDTDSVLTKVI
jgi:hypothetical protein